MCGLLGSGKTSFIKNSLAGSREKTVVLVNDFGAAGIDGEIFSAGGIESIELPGGCVCCTLKPDVIAAVQRIITEFSPGHLVIEPSGIASPSGVLEALESAGVGAFSVVGIVDVTDFAELYRSEMYGSFFKDQIMRSDLILANKTDLAEREQVAEAMDLLESINPCAILFRTVNARLPTPLVDSFPGVSGRLPAGLAGNSQTPAHFRFETVSFKLDGRIDLAPFTDFFYSLAAGRYGRVVRAKALIQSGEEGAYRLDIVFGKAGKSRFEQEIKNNRLVVIGEGLNKKGIENELLRVVYPGSI